jgi:hypothetical protein
MDTPTPSLSPSEKRTLELIARRELPVMGLDWVAVQHLKSLGLIEEGSTGFAISPEGHRVLKRLMSNQ